MVSTVLDLIDEKVQSKFDSQFSNKSSSNLLKLKDFFDDRRGVRELTFPINGFDMSTINTQQNVAQGKLVIPQNLCDSKLRSYDTAKNEKAKASIVSKFWEEIGAMAEEVWTVQDIIPPPAERDALIQALRLDDGNIPLANKLTPIFIQEKNKNDVFRS